MMCCIFSQKRFLKEVFSAKGNKQCSPKCSDMVDWNLTPCDNPMLVISFSCFADAMNHGTGLFFHMI